ncbi:sigma factor-like helix-turn-helix DNA-binding protein [Brachyspira catarrhinii]|uniref:RNA polymerase sigma factor WhiG n=1 Tax=Brachyspira catarrhinii TaxID=2528966 RepID=A0ABY2TXR9_9SPIR|nr:sigma factor-like helix-turn-helix DNA-binding protein [Brachyspira catarrhinii]TKZ36267.1 RNA polymerase sigma factor WhiG [Brachyspira catarrhinii]
MKNNNKDDLPMITDENEKEYWIEYKKTLSPQIKEALIIKYKYLLEVVANELKSNIGKGRFKGLDYEDLVCLGYSGLLEAIDKYSHDKDVKFKSYAFVIIQRAIYDEATRINYFCYPKSRFLNDAKTLLDEESKILILYYHEGLTFKEIAEKMDISRNEVHQLLTKAIEDLKIIENKSISKPSDKTNTEYLAIINALKKLPQKEQEVLILYYLDNLTLK